MLDLDTIPHHLSTEEVAQVLCNRTGKNDPAFFRVITLYYMSILASCMRAKLVSKDLGEIAINNYVLALAPSGFGKGKSTGCLENEFMAEFRQQFIDGVMPNKTEQNLWKLASLRAAIMPNGDEQVEYDKLKRELDVCGEYPFVFDGASEPAIKQIRQLLLLSGPGSINFQVDEIGSNLEKSGEALNTYLELYDQGKIKAKLTKNSHENKRGREILGSTPANMLLFGTPVRLLDSAAIEKKFISMLETGYARRCIFACGDLDTAMDIDLTAEEIYRRRIDPANHQALHVWRSHFASLADPDKLDWTVDVPDEVSIELISYQQWCNARAREMPDHHDIQKAEMEHRYFKVIKVAGVYSFIEESLSMTLGQLHSAIKLIEESGTAFAQIMNREVAYVKLARFIASEAKELTHADLDELPYYKGSQRDRSDLMTMATAWGYKNNILLKKSFNDGIEFFSGETLTETDLDHMGVSYSDDFAYNYEWATGPFSELSNLTQANGLHWCNHAFDNGHRAEENVIQGFNMLVLDIDGGVSMSSVHDLFEDYTFMTYTTKRHTPDENRFRLLLPMNYHLNLDKEDYAQFMKSVVSWLPFQVDKEANQRARKWMSYDKGTFHYNKATKETQRLLDILPFIPKTSKNEQHQKEYASLSSLDNLERWFAQRFEDGGRNNQMIKYALALTDAGFGYKEIENRVIAFNAKMSNGLSADELRTTVLVTVAKKLQHAKAA